MKDLLRTSDLERDELIHLLELAEEFKRQPALHDNLLRDQIVVLYFATPSTRARLAFEAAVVRLGGVPAVVGPEELKLGRGETLADTARIVSAYAAAFVVSAFTDEDLRTVAKHASIPVVNALTDGNHPCQSVADLLTLRERLHHFADRKLAYVGAANNVTHSLLEAAALVGLDMSIATPPEHAPDPEVVQRAEQLAEHSGAWIEVTTDPHFAVKDANAVYTDAWLSPGDLEADAARRRRSLAPYRVTRDLLAEAAPGALFMHCLPAHRGDEVAADVIDGPQSVVFDQAANGLPTAQAVVYALVNRDLLGTRHWC